MTEILGGGLPSGNPFSNVEQGTYWTGTTYESDTGYAYVVLIGFGMSIAPKAALNYVWCVRGGQGVDVQ